MKKQRKKQQSGSEKQSSLGVKGDGENSQKGDKMMLIATFVLAAIYFLFSNVSSGFYQHDEVAHLLSMKDFWNDPNSILGNWSKPGYKVFYIIPVLVGKTGVIIMNCLISAFTAFLTYKVLKLLNSKYAVLGFILLAAQPFWVQLAFRNYSELITGFLLISAVYFHYKNKFLFAALVLSYLCIIRQELYLFMAIYGLYLLIKRQWIPAFSMGIFPFLINLWGGIINGDPFYLITSIVETSSLYGGAYPRPGFDHYFKMAIIVYGATALLLFFAYLFARLFNKKHPHYFIIIPTILFFLLLCIFSMQIYEIGPATAGNLRYLMVISPLLAVIGALSMDELQDMNKRYRVFLMLIPVVVVVGVFMAFDHNNVKYSEVRNWLPLAFTIVSAFVVLLPMQKLKRTGVSIVVGGIALTVLFASVKPFELSPEDDTMLEVAKWHERMIKTNTAGVSFTEKSPLIAMHPLFFYYVGKSRFDFDPPAQAVAQEFVDSAAVGTIIIWDSHYSYRPKVRGNSVPYQFFTNRPTEYKQIRDFKASNGKFTVLVFEKIGEPDEIFNGAFELYSTQKFQEAVPEFQKALTNNPDNQASYFYLGACYHNLRNYNGAITNYNKAIALDPAFYMAYLNRSTLYMASNQMDLSLKDVNFVIEKEPQNVQAYMNRGNVYFRQKEWASALNDFVIVAKLNPKFAAAYFNIGLSQIELKQSANACSNFKRALELGYKQAEAQIKQYCSN